MEEEFASGRITIDYSQDSETGVSIELQAPGLRSPETLVLILLTVVEKVTTVRSQVYMDLLKEIQRVATWQKEKEKGEDAVPGGA